jgi:hypothetical protein
MFSRGLLKRRILNALFGAQRAVEPLFCNLLWLWFPGRELDKRRFDLTVLTHSSERAPSADTAKLFLVQYRTPGFASLNPLSGESPMAQAVLAGHNHLIKILSSSRTNRRLAHRQST